MNVETMRAVAERLSEDLNRTNLPDLLRQLAEALRNAVASPQEPQFQNQVSSLREQLRQALANSDVLAFSPAERQVLAEWKVEALLGDRLAERLEQIFRENQITLATAQAEVESLVAPLQELATQLVALIGALDSLHVYSDEPEPGEFEIDVLLPREAVNSEVRELGEEFIRLESILLPFVELVSGSRPPLEVRSIGSTEFTLFIVALPGAAAAVAVAMEKILAVYERVLNIRKVKADIESLALDGGDDAIGAAATPLEEYAQSRMKKQAREIAKEIVSEFAKPDFDEGRTNELTDAVRRSVLKMADRVDAGYNISVRAGPMPDDDADDDEGEEPSPERAQLEIYIRAVESRKQAMKFMDLSGSPILGLDPGDDDESSQENEPPS